MVVEGFTRYTVTAVLGKGSSGTTYAGTDPSSGFPVALKVLDEPPDAPGGATERLYRVASAWSGLRHPCVLPLLKAEEDGGRLAFVMARAAGAPLNRLVFEQRLEPGSLPAWRAALQVVQAFHHASIRGVAHGGLTPGDVFVSGGPEPRAQVSDFGVAAALAGRRPTLQEDMPRVANVLALLLTGEPLVHGAASGPAAPVLARAAAPEPASRFASYRQLLKALAGVAPAEVPQELRLTTPPPTPRSHASSPGPATATIPTPRPTVPVAQPEEPAPGVAPSSPPAAALEATTPSAAAASSGPPPLEATAPRAATPVAEPDVAEAIAAGPLLGGAAAVALAPPDAGTTPPSTTTPAPVSDAADTAPFVKGGGQAATAVVPSSGAPPSDATTPRVPAAAEDEADAADTAPFVKGGEQPGRGSERERRRDQAPPGRPGPARRARRRGGDPPAELPDSLRIALRAEAAEQDPQHVDTEGDQVDPFASQELPVTPGAPSVPTAKPGGDWVQRALAQSAPARPGAKPVKLRELPGPRPSPAPAAASKGRDLRPLLLVPVALLLLVGTAATLAWVLRGGRTANDEARSPEDTEEQALRRVLGIGTNPPPPERPRTKPGPAGTAPTGPSGPATLPPLGSPGDTPLAAAAQPAGSPQVAPPARPRVLRVPGGPELPGDPFAPPEGMPGGRAPHLPPPELGGPTGFGEPPARAGGAATGAQQPAVQPLPPPPVQPLAAAPERPHAAMVGGAGGGHAAPPDVAPGGATGNRKAAKRLNSRGLRAYRRGRHDQALEAYEQAIRSDPGYHWPYFNAACMYSLRGDVKRTIDRLERFARTSPDPVDLGRVVHKDRDFEPMLRNARFMDWLESRGR